MKKLFIYDDENYELLTCLLMGIDQNGNPQMVVTTPGIPVVSLQEHQEGYLYEDSFYSYLGEAGDTVPAKEIIRLFSGYLLMAEDEHKDLSELIRNLELAGLKWDDKFLKFVFHVHHQKDSEGNDIMSLCMYLDGNRRTYMAHSHRCKTVRQVIDRIRQIMYEITFRADIPATCDLCISEDLRNDMDVYDCAIFDSVYTED